MDIYQSFHGFDASQRMFTTAGCGAAAADAAMSLAEKPHDRTGPDDAGATGAAGGAGAVAAVGATGAVVEDILKERKEKKTL